MADVKISELNGATTPLSGTEVVPLVQNGVTKKVAVSEIGGGANPTSGILPVNNSGSLVDSVVSQSNGNVGIGTTTPTQALDVVGKIVLNDGGNSVFVGGQAGFYDDGTNNNNVGIGFLALNYNTTGNHNVANGYNTLRYNGTGIRNTANGSAALNRNTTGSSNAGNGYMALSNNRTGSNNVANGVFSGTYISNGGSNTTVNNSVFLGYDTRPLNDGETNQIVIGHAAVGLGSNTVVLGNDSIVTTALKGNVGIGTTNPSEALDVNGTVKAQGYKSSDGSAGVTQNVNTGGGNTLVIKNGIITQVI